MGQISQELPLNLAILRQCREQIGLSLSDVEKKVPSIKKIEQGEKRPTYKQLRMLGELYQVPRWVFIEPKLPADYRYAQQPAFRKFNDSPAFKDVKVRQLVTKVERYRDLLIELRKHLQEPIKPFHPLSLKAKQVRQAAESVRQWLHLDEPVDFPELKQKLEEKSIFVFLTSKYKGWSHIEKNSFRGLCLTHRQVPIIIINALDAKKAQSFTLIHELGHLLREEMSIDSDWQEDEEKAAEEKWCNQLAGEVLMPTTSPKWENADLSSIQGIKRLARSFCVSPYACLVQALLLEKISRGQYKQFKQELEMPGTPREHSNSLEHNISQEIKKIQGTSKKPRRDRSREVEIQFGGMFVRAALSAWHEGELSLHKTTQLFGLTEPDHVFDLEKRLT